jgi:hypothetical protein
MDVRSVVDLTSTVIMTAAAVGSFGFYLYDRGRLDVPTERYVEEGDRFLPAHSL